MGVRRTAEIGVKKGVFSRVICEAFPGVEHFCVDHYPPGPSVSWDVQEKRFGVAQKRLKDFNVQHIKKPSAHAADEIPKNSLDFVYIDADHSFENVMIDLILWAQRVRLGGIVSGHDYKLGVKDAVDAYCRHYGIELFVTTDKGGYPNNVRSWFFAKGQY
jgi:hypothetical protein